MTEADAEQRLVEFLHPSPDRRFLRDEPGMLLLLPRLHGTAEHEEDIEALEIGDHSAAVELENSRLEAVGFKMITEGTEGTEGGMLEGEHTRRHWWSTPCGFFAAPEMPRRPPSGGPNTPSRSDQLCTN